MRSHGTRVNSNNDDGGDDSDDSGGWRCSQVDELEDVKGQRLREIESLAKQLSDTLRLWEEEKERCVNQSPSLFFVSYSYFVLVGWW